MTSTSKAEGRRGSSRGGRCPWASLGRGTHIFVTRGGCRFFLVRRASLVVSRFREVTPTHPFISIFPSDSRGTYKMCTCYGTAIPYLKGPVYHTAIETNMEADVCMPGVESSRFLLFLTARNFISITTAVHYWYHLSYHGLSSSRRSLTRILVCRKAK